MRADPEGADNVVSRARSPSRTIARLPRRLVRGVFAAAGLAAIAGVAFAPTSQMRAICLIILVAGGLGWVIGWLAGTGGHLSKSNREMRDFWQDYDGRPPSP